MKKGFTLIELLIVIVIIGVLSTLLMANFVGVRARARDGVRKGDLRQIQAALEFWRTDKGTYPTTIIAPNGVLTCTGGLIDSGVTYMKKIACDPTTKIGYYYLDGGSSYKLVACLENGNDSEKKSKPTGMTQTCPTGAYYVLENP